MEQIAIQNDDVCCSQVLHIFVVNNLIFNILSMSSS